MKGIRILRLTLLLMFLSISLPRGFAQGGTPVFQRRYIPPVEEAPQQEQAPERPPVPQGLIIAGEILLAIVAAVILIAAARAWRESNVFGRQYHFRADEPAARRFGAARCGGLMAVVEPAKGPEA